MDTKAFQPGTMIANYQVDRLIHEGEQANVYLVTEVTMGRTVALKILTTVDRLSVLRIQQESKCAARINHKNVLTVYDFGITTDGAAYLLMDYIEGESLATIIQRDGVLPLKRFRHLFDQASAALSAVHSNGIIHRDVAPNNFLISDADKESEILKLIGFSNCRMLPTSHGALTQTGEIVGNPTYMSPESCMGLEVDCRSDIYSLGCCMYEALCGSPPFHGTTMVDTMSRHISDIAPSVAATNPDLKSIEYVVTRCLEKKPEDRFQSMDELNQALVGNPGKTKPSAWLRKIINP